MSETTTVRVSKTTLEMLERLRNKMNAKTLDEAIRLFIAREHKMKIDGGLWFTGSLRLDGGD